MPILLRYQILILLTMVSFVRVLRGRHIPAAPLIFTASSTPTPQIELSASAGLTADEEMGFSVVTSWTRGRRYYQHLSPPPPPLPTPAPNISIFRGRSFEPAKTIYGHRLLLGSAPPSCQGKCGACVPCFPIHVSLGGPHGSLTQQEYYPEAWRCKCDNRTFMP